MVWPAGLCSRLDARSRVRARGSWAGGSGPASSAVPKVLIWQTEAEPGELAPAIGLGGATQPNQEFRSVVHNQLVVGRGSKRSGPATAAGKLSSTKR